MARKIRKDITVKALEKKLGVAPGTIKNIDGRDARSDKKLETLQKEATRAFNATVKKIPAKPAKIKTAPVKKIVKPKAAKPVTADQKTAALRKVKRSPKATSSMVRKVQAAIKKTASK